MFYTCWCSLPLNMQFALGRALFDLFAVTGKSMYLQRAVGLCTAFNAALMKTPNNVTWLYWPAGRDSSIEDTSHGFIDVDFALMCYERGGWMTHDTLTLIAKTLNDVMLNGAEPDGAKKKFMLRVPPGITQARQAVAWTFEQDAADYKPAVQT